MVTPKPPNRRRMVVIFGAVALIAAIGIGFRLYDAWALRSHTKDDATPIVAVIKAAKGPAEEEIVLPGNVQAWHEAPIYARTSGYLKDWKTDIGAHVKEGDLLAEIDTPDVDAQLRQTEADLKTAEANNALAQTTATRWKTLLASDLVSKQDADEKIGAAAASAAALASAAANRDHLQEMENFKRVIAPFDGTITSRTTDNGALINTGSGSAAGPELFRIADTSHLRIYVQVPQNYAATLTVGMTAQLHFAEHAGKTYPAKLLRTSDAIDPVNRTLMAEFENDNTNGELLAGGYTEVHMQLPSASGDIRLPVNTLIFRSDGLQVATVDAKGNALLKTVTMGRDFGNEVEIVAGIAPDEPVIVNPPDSLATGQAVRIAEAEKKPEK